MRNQDWERFGEDIRRTVQDAVNSGDFRRLNQTVSETLGRAADEIDQAVGRAAGYWQQRKRPMPEPLYRKTKGVSLKGGFFTAAGVLIGFGGFLLAVFWGIRTGLAPLTVASLVLMCGGWLLFGLSRKLMKRIRHFREYNKIIGEREYCNVEELAEGTGLPEKKVKKDLLWMLGKGWYLQGQMSKDGACLITSRRMYEQYRRLEEERRMREEEAAEDRNREKAARAQEEEKRQSLSPEVQKVLEEGDAYVKKIRACNDAIPGVEISEKIARLELLTDRIFDRVELNPGSVSDIRKLMEYYLPTAIKLLEAYEELDAQPVAGENILSSKAEIEATLDTLNVAFEKILDSLFQDTAWDVSSDISVLNTVLAQEGLKEKGGK